MATNDLNSYRKLKLLIFWPAPLELIPSRAKFAGDFRGSRGAVQTTLNVYIKYLGSQLSVESLSFCPGVSVWLHVRPSHLKAPPIPFCPRPMHNPISIPPPYACSPSLSWESKWPIRFLSGAASQLILALFIYNLFFSVFTFWLC